MVDDTILQRVTNAARAIQADLGARRGKYLMFVVFGAILIVLSVTGLVMWFGKDLPHPLITVVSGSLIPSAILYNIFSHSYRKKGQKRITAGLREISGISFSPAGASVTAAAKRHDIIPLHKSIQAENGFEGTHRDMPFSFEEIAFEGIGRKLTGTLLRVRLGRPLTGHTVIVPHNIFQSLYRTQFNTLGKVELANPKFSRQYTVLGSDPVEARVALTSQMMEAILEVGHTTKSRWIAVSLKENEIIIFAQRNALRLECGPLWQRPLHGSLQTLLDNFVCVVQLIDVLKLNRQMAA